MSLVSGLLNQTLTSISSATKDIYGDKSFKVIYTDTPCRWQEISEQDTLPTGEVVNYMVQVWLFPDVDIRKGQRIIKNSKNYFVMKVEKRYDLDGNHDHTKVWLN